MTVAFSDVVILKRLLGQYLASRGADVHESVKSTWSEWDELAGLLRTWHWERKGLASTVNILSVALYDLFGAKGELFPFSTV